MTKPEVKKVTWYPCFGDSCTKANKKLGHGNQKCPQEVTDVCAVCNKSMVYKDAIYSKYKFGDILCAAHCGDAFWVKFAKTSSVG